MLNALVFAFILLALAIGYAFGRFGFAKKNTPVNQRYASYSKSYFESLTFLLNEETDEVIDRFIADMDVNEQTLEVHLSLGGLLRRKGELARAVRVHENLLSKTLQDKTRDLVQLELAQDYIQSGLLDRAEGLLKKIIEQNSVDIKLRANALEKLIDVYQNTSEWLKAIDVADQLTEKKFSESCDRWTLAQAQFSCELALEKTDDTEVLKWIRAALRYNPNCVRATLLQAKLEIKGGEKLKAIVTLNNAFSQDDTLASEVIDELEKLCDNPALLADFIRSMCRYLNKTQNAYALATLFRVSSAEEGFALALERIKPYLPQYPHLAPALAMVKSIEALDSKILADSLRPPLESLLKTNKSYECQRCGFRGSEIHWLCPSCKVWESVKLR
ncbi:MAG: hypothetical protein K6L76_03725 [Agarilytica sp.]